MSNVLTQDLQYTTVAIEDDLGEQVGTGFLVADTPRSTDKSGFPVLSWTEPTTHAYLVTARHVLGENPSVIECTLSYGIRFNIMGSGGLELSTKPFEISNAPRNWAVHPDASVDVAALDVTDWLATTPEIFARFCPLSEIANPMSLAFVDCDAGDDLFVIGYPLTLRQGRTGLPLIRKGVLATSPRRTLIDPVDSSSIRGFLVDGAILPGSSGSPVISTSTIFKRADLTLTTYRPLVLGVVAQEWGRGELARYNTVMSARVDLDGYANLGFAHNSATIIETIGQFGWHSPRDFLELDHERWAPEMGIPEWCVEFEGPFRDSESIGQLFHRKTRDIARARGIQTIADDYYDATDILGPVPQSAANVTTEELLSQYFPWQQRG